MPVPRLQLPARVQTAPTLASADYYSPLLESTMRKLFLSLACLAFMAGLVYAAEYTIVSYDKDKKELTIKDKDGKEVKGVATDKTKVILIDKDGNKSDGKFEDVEKRWSSDKAKGKKAELTIDTDGKITEVTVKKKN
jgi:hypothetical protein